MVIKKTAFLAFEGIDGAGKTTLIKNFESVLKKRNISYLSTCEPDGTFLGKELRNLLLTRGKTRKTSKGPEKAEEILQPKAELLLYQAARAQHVETKIQPALTKKKWVLCDRYTASTLAFQSGGRGLEKQMVEELNTLASGSCSPNLWILLDLPPQDSLKRIKERLRKKRKNSPPSPALDIFESKGESFFQRVRETYLSLVQENPHQWLTLDARQKQDELTKILEERLKADGYFME